jgi:transcriptional regulator with XRE-family HTH domain
VTRKIQPVPKTKRRPTFIRAWRKHRHLTLENLAERVGITHASLSRIERGEQPYNEDLLALLADALMCEPADLLVRDPTDPEGIWSLWDRAEPGQRRQALELLRVIIGTGRHAA